MKNLLWRKKGQRLYLTEKAEEVKVLAPDVVEITNFKKDAEGNSINVIDKVYILKVEEARSYHYNYKFNKNDDDAINIHNTNMLAESVEAIPSKYKIINPTAKLTIEEPSFNISENLTKSN
jgi:hypothetical protein